MLRWIKRRLAQTDSTATAPASAAVLTAPAPIGQQPAPEATPETAPVAPEGLAVATAPAPAPEKIDIPRDKIAARAAEIWDRKGRPHGQDVQNWMEAEAELRAEFAASPDPEPLPRKSR